MGVFTRPDSPFLWMLLERPGQKAIRESTGIPREGGSPLQNKELLRQAKEVYAARKVELVQKRYKLATAIQRRSFREHREWYAANVTVHKRGAGRELYALTSFASFFDRYDLTEIDHTIVREWRTWRRKTVKAATVNREGQTLSHMLKQAVPKYLDVNPLAGMGRLREEAAETRIVTPDEERRILEAATDPVTRAIVLCGLDALMRLGSIVNLKRAQDHGAYLTLLNAKTGTYEVPVSARLRKALDQVPNADERYFQLSSRRIQKDFAALCTQAQVAFRRAAGGVTFHGLRHTGASRMLARGIDVKTVMQIGGWRNLMVLERYLHPTDEAKRAAVDVIGRPD
jgi:integrase